MIAGHAFVQNLRRGHDELAVDEPVTRRVAAAFSEAVESAVNDTWQDPPISDDDPRAWLASLSRRQRAILALRQSKLNDSEIAAMLGCSLEEVAAVPYPRQWGER